MNDQFKRMQKLAGLITEGVEDKANDLEVKWTPEYYNRKKNNSEAYHEKGLADASYAKINGKKVKEIVGYFYDNDENED